jgi:hypothetical protein
MKSIITVKPLATAVLVFLCSVTCAQTVRLQVILKASSRDSLANATIELYSLPDTLLLQSQIGQPGKNSFIVKPLSSYLIKVSSVGFAAAEKTVAVGGKPLSVTIEMTAQNDALKEVTIVSKKPLLRQEDDKTIVDVTALANSSTNTYEVLEKTPGIVVDQDGNVYLNSSTPATVYINGRQMKMSTDDIASLLKSLPAGSISRVEILRTPSAKYDASNSGGIVNVVLKKGIKIGTTGSVNMRYDQGVYGTQTAGFSLNRSIGDINSYISYQWTHRNYYEDLNTVRNITMDSLLTQVSSTNYHSTTHYFGGGLDIALSKQWNIAYDLRLTATHNDNTANSTNDIADTSGLHAFFKSETPISNGGNTLFTGHTFSSRYKIDSTGSEWTNEVGYIYTRNTNTQVYTNNYFLPAAPVLNGNGYSLTTANIVSLKTDLLLKLRHQFTFETGISLSYADNNNAANYYKQTGNGPPQADTYQTNSFTYKEHISAGYLQLTKSLFGIVLKSGLRLEKTNTTGQQFIPSDTSFAINRTDLFPYFFVKRNLFKILGYPLTGNVIFRRSITRPGYDALNPSPKFVDPFTYNVGNPKLQPQFTANYEINASYNDFPVFAVGENDTKDIFSQVTYQNDSSKIAYRSYDNLGKNKELYGRLFGGLPAGGKYFMYVGAQYNYVMYDGQYQGVPLHYRRGSWTFFTGHEFKASSTLRFNLNAWMYVNGFRTFYELKNMGQLNYSMTKTVMKNKLSIILSGTDVLKTNISSFHLEQGDVLVNGRRVQDSRRFGITFRYNFGIAPKEEKKPAFVPPPVNDSN